MCHILFGPPAPPKKSQAQELSNTAWSFTTVLHVHPASAAMAHAALRRLDEFHARHSANLVPGWNEGVSGTCGVPKSRKMWVRVT